MSTKETKPYGFYPDQKSTRCIRDNRTHPLP